MIRRILLSLIAICACLPPLSAAQASQSDQMPTPLYAGIVNTNLFIRKEPSQDSESIGVLQNGDKAYIVDYDPSWLKIVKGDEVNWVTGYVLRHRVTKIVSLVDVAYPYGTTPAAFTATITEDTMLYAAPSEESDALFLLSKGTRMAILAVENGWAQVVFQRQYGYFYLDKICDLTPVYGEEYAKRKDTISAFISFYSTKNEGSNPNRMFNIALACDYISIELGAGEEFSFDDVAGPYQGIRGYLPANSFYEGEVVPSYGGGCCQVSSTLYNVLLAMPKGIDVLQRAAHGPSGITYLPHGVDAACGNKSKGLNLVFKNIYSFPIKIEACAYDGVLFIAIQKL